MKKQKIKDNPAEIIAVDFGCGENKIPSESNPSGHSIQQYFGILPSMVIGVDFVKTSQTDIVHDLTKIPYPFKDESIQCIFSSHFIEHLDGFERAKFMDECYRILKPNGKMILIHPYYKSIRASQDFTHKWPPISEFSYLYFDKNWREANKLTHGHYNLKCDYEFQVFYAGYHDNSWSLKNEETRNFAIDHYFNVVTDMRVDLTKRQNNK